MTAKTKLSVVILMSATIQCHICAAGAYQTPPLLGSAQKWTQTGSYVVHMLLLLEEGSINTLAAPNPCSLQSGSVVYDIQSPDGR